MTGPLPPLFDPFVDEPEFNVRWPCLIAAMLDELNETDRAEFRRILREEPGTMKCWPAGDWFQFTVGEHDQLVLGTVNRGEFHKATTPGNLN